MPYLIGFLIAVFIALTGVGAGTITTPLLIFFLGVPMPAAVTTGLAYSAAVKLVMAPAQIWRRQVSWRVLGCMLAGGLPGVLLGTWLLGRLATTGSMRLVTGLLGAILVLTALYQIFFSFRPLRRRGEGRDRRGWLPLLMLPVGAEVGFSSAGAGALGTAALLSLTRLQPAQVVGTDILFGLLLSLAGSGAHWLAQASDPALLRRLVLGGLPGAVAGTLLGGVIPRRPLRILLWVWLLVLGSQFLYRCF